MARSFKMNLTLEDDLHQVLAAEAEDTRRSLADVIRDRLRESVLGGSKAEAKGVGGLAVKLLSKGYTNERVLEEVQKAFPQAKTSLSSISWYRSDMRRRGVKVLSQIEARSREGD